MTTTLPSRPTERRRVDATPVRDSGTDARPCGELRAVPARVTVVGCGHVGLVMAAGLAELGHRVVGLDIDEALVAELRTGSIRIREPGLPELVERGIADGRLTFSSDYAEAIPGSEFVFLAVDTPQTLAGAANLRPIRSATRAIARALPADENPIIVNKSTSPIGTGETIESILARALTSTAHAPRIVSNPEFLQQGRAVRDFFEPDRIVIGSRSRDDTCAVASLYAALPGELVLTDLRTAEMIKYVANSYLATRISFINEVARLCEQIGVDVDDVVTGVAYDPRIGGHFFRPGIGFGGSCLPKDVAALRFIGETHGVGTPLLSAVQEINAAQRSSAVRRLRARLGSLEGRTIGVWGLTFKGNTEDLRESPALDVASLLYNEGAVIQAFDPGVSRLDGAAPAWLGSALVSSPIEAARGADALAILTDWPQFAEIELDEVRSVMAGIVLFDGRNLLSKAAAEAAGFAYLGIGRNSTHQRRRRTDR